MNSICIGCGCTDERACTGGCTWLRIDRAAGVGVCSSCLRDTVARWDGGDHSVTPAAHAARTAKCKSCGARIIWFKTARGSNMPVNYETVQVSDVTLDLKKHVSHFATCENAAKHRKPR